MTTFTFLFGAAELLIGIGLSHLPVVTRALANPGLKDFVNIPVVQGISWSSLPMLAYIGIGVTGLGFAFYFIAMERSDVSTASLVFFIKPGLAPIMAAIILGERIPGLTIVGIVIILLGSVISFVGESFIERVDKMLPWHKKDSVHDL